MRLLIRLKALKDFAYDKKYYSKLRGFFYNLQEGSKYFNQHDKKGYKFYCFSNIFSFSQKREEIEILEDEKSRRWKVIKENEKRIVIVSSPDKDFIYYLRGKIEETKEGKKPLNIGEMSFEIENLEFLEPKIGKSCKLITGTPIVLRIPKEKYSEYGIESKRPFEYWKPPIDFQAFVRQLEDNLVKKYNEYYGEKIDKVNLFEQFRFKKSVCVHRIEEGQEIKTIGSNWEFGFSYLNNLQQKLLKLGLETGLGELNSGGFGFVSIVKS